MKKTEIATRVFTAVSSLALTGIEAGPLVVPLADLCGLMLVPWFCDGSIQWALRLTSQGGVLKKSSLKQVKAASVTITGARAMLIGIPGDGVRPYLTSTFLPLCEALTAVAQPGDVLELATANLGLVVLDEGTFKAGTGPRHGNQLYVGTIDADGNWMIQQSSLALSVTTLERALDCGRKVAHEGPWTVENNSEAYAILMQWMESKQANINPSAVKHFIKFGESRFIDSGIGRDLLCGLGLAFFRCRLANTCFQWQPPDPIYVKYVNQKVLPGQECPEEVARQVAGLGFT
jgi:hypothetical protein